MKYQGGKTRVAKELARVLLAQFEAPDAYWEPFVGGGNALVEIAKLLPAHTAICAGDTSAHVIELYRAYARGKFTPPAAVSREEYAALRATWCSSPPSAIHGFAGTACSFAGKWFGTYATRAGGGEDFCGAGARWLHKHRAILERVHWLTGTYAEQERHVPAHALTYCDPPYANTAQSYASARFDSGAFWHWAETRQHIAVSEYAAPAGWLSVWQRATKTTLHHTGTCAPRVEQLFARGTL